MGETVSDGNAGTSDSAPTRSASPRPASDPSHSGLGFRSRRGPVLISIMLGTALVAVDSTVVATAVPSIVDDLGGFAQFPWLFSIYLLGQAVFTPIYGKLADLVGRKPIMLLGIGLFLAGSIAAGFAWSMWALIAFRALQGLGAGAVQPMAMTIAGDIYTVAERARITGYLASVWGISAIIGPVIGGVFSDYVSWRWIFFINVPLCLLAAWMLMRSFHEKVERKGHRVDVTGAMLVAGGFTLVILAVLEGGTAWAWTSVAGISVLAAGLAMLVAFVFVEMRAAEPVLPLWIFTRRVLVTTTLVAFCVGAVVLGLTGYIPTYAQDSLGTTALVAGFTVAPMSIGWPITSSLSGKIYLRFGFRVTGLLGAGIILAALLAMAGLLDADSPVWWVPVLCFSVGCGLGLVASPSVIAAQASVGWSSRGVVTGTNTFSRSIGSSLGVAAFGAVANAALGPSTGGHSGIAIAGATHDVLLTAALVAALMLVAVLLMPGGRDTSQVTD